MVRAAWNRFALTPAEASQQNRIEPARAGGGHAGVTARVVGWSDDRQAGQIRHNIASHVMPPAWIEITDAMASASTSEEMP